jgi:hypothetical protein
MHAYAFLAGHDAVPQHEVDGPIQPRRRLGHEALKKVIKRMKPCIHLKDEPIEYVIDRSMERASGRT